MKSRTSFSKWMLLRKDITRFAPLWGLHLIFILLTMLAGAGDFDPFDTAYDLATSTNIFMVLNMFYSFLCALVLFSDLYKSRICNALHAMPPRRDQWFAIHVTAGLLFSLVPETIGLLCLLPSLGKYWDVGLCWLLIVELEFLFFFSLATLCCMCAGTRLGAAALYGIANFAAPICAWLVDTVYAPMLPGVVVSVESLILFCPMFRLGELELMLDNVGYWPAVPNWPEWIYLFIVAGVGIVLLLLALVLYRRRKLETAGDFIAVRALKPVFLLLHTFSVSAQFAVSYMVSDQGYLVSVFIGMMIGYFTGQMLLRRTVKVFQFKTFLRFAGLAALVALSMVMVWLDPLGLVHWTPKADQVESVSIHIGGTQSAVLTEQEDIEKLIQIHESLMGEEQPEDYWPDNLLVELHYEMKDGTTKIREYAIPENADTESLRLLLSQTNVVLWAKDPEILHSQVKSIRIEDLNVPNALMDEALDAVIADCEAGNMVQAYLWDYETRGSIDIVYVDESGNRRSLVIRYDSGSTHVCQWFDEYRSELGLTAGEK